MNIRGMPEEVMAQAKSDAALGKMTLKEWVIRRLSETKGRGYGERSGEGDPVARRGEEEGGLEVEVAEGGEGESAAGGGAGAEGGTGWRKGGERAESSREAMRRFREKG